MNNKMFIVKYSKGSYESYEEICVFVTDKKSIATKYVTKFNRLLKKWKKHNEQFEDKDSCIDWIADKYSDRFNRWYAVRETNKCWWEEIEFRPG